MMDIVQPFRFLKKIKTVTRIFYATVIISFISSCTSCLKSIANYKRIHPDTNVVIGKDKIVYDTFKVDYSKDWFLDVLNKARQLSSKEGFAGFLLNINSESIGFEDNFGLPKFESFFSLAKHKNRTVFIVVRETDPNNPSVILGVGKSKKKSEIGRFLDSAKVVYITSYDNEKPKLNFPNCMPAKKFFKKYLVLLFRKEEEHFLVKFRLI